VGKEKKLSHLAAWRKKEETKRLCSGEKAAATPQEVKEILKEEETNIPVQKSRRARGALPLARRKKREAFSASMRKGEKGDLWADSILFEKVKRS